MNTPNRRYIEGLSLAQMDSRDEWGDSDGDYVIKKKSADRVRGSFLTQQY